MRIGELAQETGTTPRLLRYYEEQGLLRPGRGANGYREYNERHLEKVRTIRCLLNTGMPIRLIRVILPCFGGGEDVHTVVPSADLREDIVEYRDRLEQRVDRLMSSRSAIDAYLERVDAVGALTPVAS